jgi:uncharacterized protein YhaN
LAEQREQVSEDEESLKLALEEETAMKHRYEVYKKTLEYLEQAKIGFTTKYMEPIMKGFRKYYRILTGRDADGYWMNANMELSVQEAGVQQDVHFLSEGYRNLTGICLRMAMVEAMYQEEKPFVIFDDPFVNLDDENLRGGLAFLREAAKDYQLIYFTCHESRSTSLGDSAQA